MKNLPNFLIIGVHKSGTTSLYNYLNKHPQIFLSKLKEPFFLSFAEEKYNKEITKLNPPGVIEYDKYTKLFYTKKFFKAKGEASSFYLYLYN